MANRHNSLERIVHRASEEIHASRMIAKETSFSEGINAFRAKLDIQVMNHNGYQESDAVKARLLRKHEAVLRYLESRFGDYYAPMTMMRPYPLLPLIEAIRFGCAGGRDWIPLLKL